MIRMRRRFPGVRKRSIHAAPARRRDYYCGVWMGGLGERTSLRLGSNSILNFLIFKLHETVVLFTTRVPFFEHLSGFLVASNGNHYEKK
jgi:hypothetical protein